MKIKNLINVFLIVSSILILSSCEGLKKDEIHYTDKNSVNLSLIEKLVGKSIQKITQDTEKSLKQIENNLLLNKENNNKEFNELLEKTIRIQSSSDSINKYIQEMRDQIIELNGGLNASGGIIDPQETKKIKPYLYGNIQKVSDLKIKLEKFISEINEIDKNFNFSEISIDEIPKYGTTKNGKTEYFYYKYFKDQTAYMSLIILTELSLEIAIVENQAINFLIKNS